MLADTACLSRAVMSSMAAAPSRRARICGIVLGSAFSTLASAQLGPPVPSAELGQIRCSAAAVAPLVRIEGTRELVGDISITCENSGRGQRFEPSGFLEVDLALSLNVGIANQSGFGLGADITDAVLVVNEKTCLASAPRRLFSDCGAAGRTVQDPLLGRRSETSPGLLLWTGVALPIPGAAIGGESVRAAPVEDCTGRFGVPGGCHPTTTSVRLTNIRVNAAEAGVGSDAGSGAIPIEATLSLSTREGNVVLRGGTLAVAQAAPGITASTNSPEGGRLCSVGEALGEVRISEGFASAFKAAGRQSFQPGQPGWADDYYPSAAGAPAQPMPTRVRIGLSSVPEGVSIAAPVAPMCVADGGDAGLRLGLVVGASASGAGGTVVSGGQGGDVRLPVTEAGEATAVYEVLSADPTMREECRLQLRMTPSDRDGPNISGGRVAVDASLAPLGVAASVEAVGEGPRFVHPKRTPRPSLRVSSCGTTLFFPFVTNQTTFDTAVVLVNTSSDPLGTRHQPGSCSLTFHAAGLEGERLPAVQRTVEVDPGEQVAFRLSSGNPALGVEPLPDFQGYLVAQCGFQYAQGFVFVTEQVGGASVLAQGYLAEVLSQDPQGETSSSVP